MSPPTEIPASPRAETRKPSLLGATRSELAARLEPHLDRAFRVDQIYRAIYERRVDDFTRLTDLPRSLRERLAENFTLARPQIVERPEKVAIVGSGPAGLTVAYYLRLKGYQVTIFEALQELGGMLRVGIPDYRLPPEILAREVNYILRSTMENVFLNQ